MAVFVLLLRAIGPVTHAKMSMAALRDKLGAAGLEDVITVGNTGNVICRSTDSAAQVRSLAQGVVDSFGISSEVFIRTPRQMQMVVWANPFPDAAVDHPAALGVASFHRTPSWPAWVDDHGTRLRLATSGAHLVADFPDGIASAVPDFERRIGARMTMRNWRVFASLADKAAALAKQSRS